MNSHSVRIKKLEKKHPTEVKNYFVVIEDNSPSEGYIVREAGNNKNGDLYFATREELDAFGKFEGVNLTIIRIVEEDTQPVTILPDGTRVGIDIRKL